MSRADPTRGHRASVLATTWLALLGWLAAAAFTSAPAQAHAALVGTDPASGAVLEQVPRHVSLQFSEDIAPEFVVVNVRVAGSEPEQVRTSVKTATVRAMLDGILTSGTSGNRETWQLDYRVISVDGHPITGSLEFAAPAPADDPAKTASDEAGAGTAGAPAKDSDERSAAEPASATARGGTAWAPTLTVGGITLAVVAVAVSVLVRGSRSAS